MKLNTTMMFLVLLLSGGFVGSVDAAQNPLTGYWEGVGKSPIDEMRFMVTFKTDADRIEGSIDIPDSGILAWSLAKITVNNSKVHFEFPTDFVNVPFDGEVSGDSMSGTLRFGFATIPFVLKRGPARTLPYAQEEVVYKNGSIRLAATLLIPSSKGPHPAIVFHHGAYPDTRNVWRFYADHFARRGIACLIYDNRGAGDSTGYPRASFEDLASDALAGVQFLKSGQNINRQQIGLFAGSQGGWISPLAASRSKDVAFIMQIAAPGVTVARNVLYESETRLRRSGFSEEEIKRALAVKQSVEYTARTESWEKAEPVYQAAQNEKWFTLIGIQPKNSWFRWWWTLVGNYDPAPMWEKITIPVLNVDGELDKSVPVEESFTSLERSLKRAGNKDFTLKVFPKADHSIHVISQSGRPIFAPGFLDFITDWLLKRVNVRS